MVSQKPSAQYLWFPLLIIVVTVDDKQKPHNTFLRILTAFWEQSALSTDEKPQVIINVFK